MVLLGEDIGTLGGVFRVTDGLQREFGADRVMDTPLAEAGIMGVAVGLAYRGYRPVVEIQFDGFVYPAVDQLITQVARIHYRTGGAIRMPITVRIPYGGGIGAVEHHSESPEAFFAHAPGLRVVTCASPQDAHTMIRQAIACDDPVVFFEPKRRYWVKGEVDESLLSTHVHRCSTAPASSSRARTSRSPPTARSSSPRATPRSPPWTTGSRSRWWTCARCRRSTSTRSRSSVRKTGRLVVSHEAQGSGGLGAEIVAGITDRCFDVLKAAPARVTGFDTPYPAAKVEEHFLPDLDRMLDAVDRVMGRAHSLTGWRAS